MIIGLTGRVGTGKTTAQGIFLEEFPFTLLDLDSIGHKLLEEQSVINALVNTFGHEILENMAISRPALGKIVFSNKDALLKLNSIIHPRIKKHVLNQIESSKVSFLIVGALIQEIGLSESCDHVIVIDVEDNLLTSRLGKKVSILPNQRSRDSYLGEADFVIQNDYDDRFYDACRMKINEVFRKSN